MYNKNQNFETIINWQYRFHLLCIKNITHVFYHYILFAFSMDSHAWAGIRLFIQLLISPAIGHNYTASWLIIHLLVVNRVYIRSQTFVYCIIYVSFVSYGSKKVKVFPDWKEITNGINNVLLYVSPQRLMCPPCWCGLFRRIIQL